MIKTFTAEEFLTYTRSFIRLYIWEGPDKDNGLYVNIDPLNLRITKRKNTYAISGEVTRKTDRINENCGFAINGNVFYCDIDDENFPMEMLVWSDKNDVPIKFKVTNGIKQYFL